MDTCIVLRQPCPRADRFCTQSIGTFVQDPQNRCNPMQQFVFTFITYHMIHMFPLLRRKSQMSRKVKMLHLKKQIKTIRPPDTQCTSAPWQTRWWLDQAQQCKMASMSCCKNSLKIWRGGSRLKYVLLWRRWRWQENGRWCLANSSEGRQPNSKEKFSPQCEACHPLWCPFAFGSKGVEHKHRQLRGGRARGGRARGFLARRKKRRIMYVSLFHVHQFSLHKVQWMSFFARLTELASWKHFLAYKLIPSLMMWIRVGPAFVFTLGIEADVDVAYWYIWYAYCNFNFSGRSRWIWK